MRVAQLCATKIQKTIKPFLKNKYLLLNYSNSGFNFKNIRTWGHKTIRCEKTCHRFANFKFLHNLQQIWIWVNWNGLIFCFCDIFFMKSIFLCWQKNLFGMATLYIVLEENFCHLQEFKILKSPYLYKNCLFQNVYILLPLTRSHNN